MMRITSSRNDKVRYVEKLARRRYRYQEGRFVAEGPRLVGEALASGARLHSLYLAPELFDANGWKGLLSLLPDGLPVYELTPALFRQVASTEAPQGILAVVEMRSWTWRDCCAGASPLAVIVDGLQDPGNLGAILRAAEALGGSGVVLGEGTADPYNAKTVRATMGAVYRLPVAHSQELAEVIPQMKARGMQVLVASARAGRPVYEVDWCLPTAVVLGNEGAGVSPALAALADAAIRIPMPGRAESLNVGMAAGILLYEAMRQRTRKTEGNGGNLA